MKKLLLNFWNFCRSIFLQILLLAVAFESWSEAQRLGSKESFESISGYRIDKRYSSGKKDILFDVDSSITSGYDGGAIAMGLIACICIYCIVWLQINKTKQ
jgi:hypothetical protein